MVKKINAQFTKFDEITDALAQKGAITVHVRATTGGRRYTIGAGKDAVEFSLKELIHRSLTLAKDAKVDSATLESLLGKLKDLDKEGKDKLDLKETNLLARVLTQIRSLFGNIIHGKNAGFRELEKHIQKRSDLESLTKGLSALSQTAEKQEPPLANSNQVVGPKVLTPIDEFRAFLKPYDNTIVRHPQNVIDRMKDFGSLIEKLQRDISEKSNLQYPIKDKSDFILIEVSDKSNWQVKLDLGRQFQYEVFGAFAKNEALEIVQKYLAMMYEDKFESIGIKDDQIHIKWRDAAPVNPESNSIA